MSSDTKVKECISGINPQHPKDSLDGVMEAGWKIKSWNMNFEGARLEVIFYHCGKDCNIESHECIDCDACKYCECECN